MAADALIARVLAQRESWVEVEPGKRVRVRRPAEAEMPEFRAGMSIDLLCRHVVGWEGFAEADLLGPALGASDPTPFDAELFAVVARDHLNWFEPIAAELSARISAHWQAREATAKN